MARIVRAIRDDEDALLTASAPALELERPDPPCLSLPRIVGAGGIRRTLFPALSGPEQLEWSRSADILRASAHSVGLD